MQFDANSHKQNATSSLGSVYGITASQNKINGAPPLSPMMQIEETLGEARELAARIQALADMALGPLPTCADRASGRETPSGSIQSLQASAAATSELLSDAKRACLRLEQALS